MKKFISFLSSYLGHAGAYFMFTMLVFGFVSLAAESATVNLVLIWTSLLFSALVALCDLVFLIKALGSYIAKVAIHGVLTILSFAFSFILVSGVIESDKTAIFAVIFFTVFYFILAAIRIVCHTLTAKKENSSKSYQNLYTPKNLD